MIEYTALFSDREGDASMDTLLAIANQTQDYRQSSVYQILVGKRTVATLFYAYQHDLEGLFALFPRLEKATWEAATMAVQGGESEETLPAVATQLLRYRRGLLPNDNHYMRQLSYRLLLQVLANGGREGQYVPLTHHVAVQHLVKQYLYHQRQTAPIAWPRVHHQIQQELTQVLTAFSSPVLADALVATLTGHTQRALTNAQLRAALALPEDLEGIITESLWDYFDQQLAHTPHAQALQFFQYGVRQRFPAWSPSVERTKQLAQAGHSLEAIAHIRRLKTSTISDHFIELLLTEPEWLTSQLEQSLAKVHLPLETAPPANYQAYHQDYPEAPFWLFRYWEIQAKKREEGKDD